MCHCHIHVTTKRRPFPVGHVRPSLESLLCCPVVEAHLVRASSNSAYKVKINKDHLHQALGSCGPGFHHKVRLWKSNARHLFSQPVLHTPVPSSSPIINLSITTWNCRGFKNSEPYLRCLSDSADIILLQEHWLWPSELQKLSSVIHHFKAYGLSDYRLSDTSTLNRGCGGVAFLWNRSLTLTPVTLKYNSDCFCGIELSLTTSSYPNKVVIFNVYAPSS